MGGSRVFSWILAAALSPPLAVAAADPLPVAFNERPPYHYTVKGERFPRGIVADIVVKALRDAGVDARYLRMESDRIMEEIRADAPFCSFGWFKTRERLGFAKFTGAIWQDRPFVVVCKTENEGRLRARKTLADLFGDAGLIFGTRRGTAYGAYVDNLKKNARAYVVEPPNTQEDTVKMLAANRFHFMILAPDEIDALFAAAGLDPGEYARISFSDMPPGGKRRIMCSRGVPDRLIETMNASLAKFVAPGVLD